MFFDLNIIMFFTDGKLFLKILYIRIKGSGVVKMALLNIYHKIYEWHLILQTNYTEQELQLRL
jgi:hypothetical protein